MITEEECIQEQSVRTPPVPAEIGVVSEENYGAPAKSVRHDGGRSPEQLTVLVRDVAAEEWVVFGEPGHRAVCVFAGCEESVVITPDR